MAHPFRLYRPQRTDPELLEKTFVGREHILEEIQERLGRWTPGSSRQHYLFIGPRGIGKTNLLRLVEHRVRTRDALREKWLPIVLAEDFYGVSSVSDLLVEALRLLAQETADERFEGVYEKVRYDSDSERVNDRCLDAFRLFHRDGGRGVLLVLENLNRLLERQMKRKQEIHLFRKILIEEEWLVALCTSSTYLNAVTEPEEPFFEFFKVHTLAELGPGEQKEMLRRLAKAEENEDFDRYLERYQSRLRALYHFTGGNPRLTIMLYDLIAHHDMGGVKNELDFLLDQLTPFYQDRMGEISDQEAKVLETIALMPEGCTPTELAHETRLQAKVVRAVLSRLEHAGYVRREERRKRRTVYIVPERFFRIWHQMNHSRAMRGQIQYLLEFFSSWYATREERDSVWTELTRKFAHGLQEGDGRRVEDIADYMEYIVEISEGQEKFKRIFEKISKSIPADNIAEIRNQLTTLDRQYQDEFEYHVHKGLFLAESLQQLESALNAFEQAIELKDNDVFARFNYAVTLDKLGRVQEAETAYWKVSRLLSPRDEPLAILHILKTSPNRGLARLAAHALGRTRNRELVEEISSVLGDTDIPWRRRHCATALGLLGFKSAVDILFDHINDADNAVRGAVATALGRIGDPRSFDALVDALNDDDPINRGSAATALGQIGDPRCVDDLIDALNDDNSIVRGSTATALGQIGDPRCVDALVDALNDDASNVRGSAATALGQIDDPRSVNALVDVLNDDASNVRGSAAAALGRIGGDPRCVDALVDALNDDASDVRGSAAKALRRIGDPRSVNALMDVLDDDAYNVRGSAIIALRKIGDPRSVDALNNDVSEVQRHFVLQQSFGTGNIELIKNTINRYIPRIGIERQFWLEYELAFEYLTGGRDPTVLERQQPEMREAIQLLVGLFDEASALTTRTQAESRS